MWKLIAACLALGGVSLLLPSEPSYDPLAWLIWGRELAHFHLDTTGGPSWKPLPVVFTTLTAPLGELDHGLPPALWMAVARAGSLLALAFAFRLANRLAGGGVAGALGGTVAALALFLTPDWFQFGAHGSEAPLAVGLMLWAIERHLDGRVAHAVVLGTLVCLMRPELFPFLGLYGLWAWRAEPRLRPLLAGAFVLLPLAWIVPDWIGSGLLLRTRNGGPQARSPTAWSLSLADHPWLRALERVHNHAGLPVELLAAFAVIVALACGPYRRCSPWPARRSSGGGPAGRQMTQAGFSGNPRYVLPALAVGAVLAGVGAANLAQAVPSRAPSAAQLTAGVAATVALLALAAHGFFDSRVTRLRGEAQEVGVRMQLHRDLARAVRDRRGRRRGAAAGLGHDEPRTPDPAGVGAGRPDGADREPHRLPRDLPFVAGAARRPRVHTGRARFRETLARVGSFRVYRRDESPSRSSVANGSSLRVRLQDFCREFTPG